ncbi:MAG: AI-2E family transporter, partial [Dehalococcoidia bacterium]
RRLRERGVVERSFWFRLALILVSLSAMIFLIDALRRFWGFLGDILLAIFFAWLVASILLHIINNLMRIPKMRRPWAIAIVYLALITLVADFAFLVVPAAVNQVVDIAELLPEYVDQLPALVGNVEDLVAQIGIEIQLLNQFQLDSIDQVVANAADWATANSIEIVQSVFSALLLVGLVIVLSFYFVLDGGRRLNESLKVLPARAEREVRFVLRIVDETFYGYVRGMFVISLLYGIAVAIVMLATGLPAAFPTAIITAIILAIPFVGGPIALILPSLIALLAGDFPTTVLIVGGSLLLFQQIMGNLLEPRILGRAVRMPAMIVVVAVIVGARLAGVAGALMGVPLSAVAYILAVHYGMRIRHAREAREAAAMAERTAAATPGHTMDRSDDDDSYDRPEWGTSYQPRPVAGGAPDEGRSAPDRPRRAPEGPDENGGPGRPRTRRPSGPPES